MLRLCLSPFYSPNQTRSPFSVYPHSRPLNTVQPSLPDSIGDPDPHYTLHPSLSHLPCSVTPDLCPISYHLCTVFPAVTPFGPRPSLIFPLGLSHFLLCPSSISQPRPHRRGLATWPLTNRGEGAQDPDGWAGSSLAHGAANPEHPPINRQATSAQCRQ